MTLVVVGPVTKDLVIIGDEKSFKVGGATYFQSFVFEKYFNDYLAIVNCDNRDLVKDFPNPNKVKVIKKDNTHFFINKYPFRENLDIREQLSNFANIPIYPNDLKDILPETIDGFVINPLNRFDFPHETVDYIKSFEVPIFLSMQGLLRIPGEQVNENYTIKLSNFDELPNILSNISAIFLDELESNIVGEDINVDEMVITNGSHGSRIICSDEIKIKPVKCENIVDTTGCGDTYMAAYVSKRLTDCSIKKSGDFASKIASEKLKKHGHY